MIPISRLKKPTETPCVRVTAPFAVRKLAGTCPYYNNKRPDRDAGDDCQEQRRTEQSLFAVSRRGNVRRAAGIGDRRQLAAEANGVRILTDPAFQIGGQAD